ncbi:MAG TPA: serine hydrolase, partial [Gemmatimonadaceae bacterium]|nr:serine hydrolase [Gemmatimonadaceae bacterium]
QWRLQMPFENVYGNSSLLTTVEDLLKWVANLSHKRVGGDEFVGMQLTRGKLRNGRTLRYASGLTITDFRGEREIYHDGATAGYRTFLASYPDAGYAVALLCNAGNVDPVALGHQVASVVLPRRERPATPKRDTVGITVRADRLAPLTGFYRLERSDDPLNLIVENGRLRIADGPFLVAITDRHFTTPSGRTHFVFDDPSRPGTSSIKTWVDDSDTTQYIPVGAPPKPETFRDFAGNYESDEADAKVSVMIEKGTLMMFSRPATRIQMVPMYANSFEMGAGGPAVKFTRDKNGKIDGFLVTSGRARNVRFDRVISR